MSETPEKKRFPDGLKFEDTIWVQIQQDGWEYAHCPLCGISLNYPTNYCPQCGANMKKMEWSNGRLTEKMKNKPIERREEAIPEGYVKVVRCSKCKHYNYDDFFDVNYCDLSDMVYDEDFYCGFGERKEETK